MQLGVVDDVAVLAETDIRNKENILERKSLYSQQESQIQQLQEQLQDNAGTIETLERQLVQSGIKGKVMQAEMEITKKKEDVKSNMKKEYLETEAKQKLLRGLSEGNNNLNKARAKDILGILKKDLENRSEQE